MKTAEEILAEFEAMPKCPGCGGRIAPWSIHWCAWIYVSEEDARKMNERIRERRYA